MEKIAVDDKTEEILKELDNIYGTDKCKEIIRNYVTYIRLRNAGKINFGTYNIFITNNSKYGTSEQLIKVIWKILKENKIISTSYKYLERENRSERRRKENKNKKKNKKEDDENEEEENFFKEVKEQLCIVDTDKLDMSLSRIRNELRTLMTKHPEKIFIIIDKDNSYGFFFRFDDEDNEDYGWIDDDFGDLISWTMKIEETSKENNINYITKFLKKNSIKIDSKSTFVECLAEQKYWKVKSEMQNIVLECKAKDINKITDEVIAKDLKRKYYKKVNKLAPMQELDSMIGIKDVKRQVEQIVNYIKVNKNRTLPSLHMCFLGNPGTGKTTVARIIGRIFSKMKILSDKEIFVEAQRSDLVGEYIGSTAPKTKRKVNQADGGVLFIDEAYSLNPKDSGRDYGHECIATLMKEMEDKRESLCVILAGYTKETKEMLEVNPGFESRIQFYIEFPDYTEEELCEIFYKMAKDSKYKVSNNIKSSLIKYFATEKQKENFSNARCVRNLFEKVKFEQADRIVNNPSDNANFIKKCDIDNVLSKLTVQEVKKRKIGFGN